MFKENIKLTKKTFSLIFELKNKERGALVSGTTLIIGGIGVGVAVLGAIYAWFKGVDFLNGLILGAGYILLAATGMLLNISTYLLDWVTSTGGIVNFSYTGLDNPVVAAGWPVVRDLANMFIVLGFVVIGIATTLRIQEYEAKKLLPKLIIVALLINFSLLITGIFIDASNITMKFFLDKSHGKATTTYLESTIKNEMVSITEMAKTSGKVQETLAALAGISFFNLVGFIIFMLFAFLFLFRYVALWILVVLSPLAFVCYVFPFTRKIFEMWWSNFFGWCIVGISGGFFIWLADTIISDPRKLTRASGGFGSLMVFLVPGFLLIIGFLVSLQTSAMGASMAIGAFKGTGKFAGSAINKSRLGDAGRGAKNLAARVGAGMSDRVGLTTGARSKTSANAVDKAHKDKGMDSHTDDEILRQIDHRGATGAAAFKEATKRKILNQYAGGDPDRLAERTAHAEGWGVNRTDAENLVPELARHGRRADELTGTVNPATGARYTRPEAQRQAVRERNQRQSASKLKDFTAPQLNQNLAEDVSFSNMQRARLDMNDEQKRAWADNALYGPTGLIAQETIMVGGAAPRTPAHPSSPAHPRHEEYMELTNKIMELSRR